MCGKQVLSIIFSSGLSGVIIHCSGYMLLCRNICAFVSSRSYFRPEWRTLLQPVIGEASGEASVTGAGTILVMLVILQ